MWFGEFLGQIVGYLTPAARLAATSSFSLSSEIVGRVGVK